MNLGIIPSNEQRVTTWRAVEFYATTHYIYETDVFMLNISYTFSPIKNKAKFIKSEFSEKEF